MKTLSEIPSLAHHRAAIYPAIAAERALHCHYIDGRTLLREGRVERRPSVCALICSNAGGGAKGNRLVQVDRELQVALLFPDTKFSFPVCLGGQAKKFEVDL